MTTNPYYSGHELDKNEESFTRSKQVTLSEASINQILGEYKELLEIQSQERQELLEQFDQLSNRTNEFDNLDDKIEHLITLLADIRKQISALSDVGHVELSNRIKKEGDIRVPGVKDLITRPHVLATEEQINNLSKEIEKEALNFDEEIQALTHLVDNKTEEIKDRDRVIDELNMKLESVSDEKERLTTQLENLNSVIGSWQGQLSLLQKLAASDPRYRVIGALKKHGSLSDIQLAFTMGTSISQIRKYIDDLRELELVAKDNAGRYQWIGGKLSDEDMNF